MRTHKRRHIALIFSPNDLAERKTTVTENSSHDFFFVLQNWYTHFYFQEKSIRKKSLFEY